MITSGDASEAFTDLVRALGLEPRDVLRLEVQYGMFSLEVSERCHHPGCEDLAHPVRYTVELVDVDR